MKARAVEFSPEAQADLIGLYEIIAAASGPVTAGRYLARIEMFCRRLDLGSERGTIRNDIRPGLRVIGFEKRVSVAFTVTIRSVLILRVRYGGTDWQETDI